MFVSVFHLSNNIEVFNVIKTGPQQLDEYFIDLPPELCELKVLAFSKDIGSSISLLPSIMHRLENLLVAIELKHVLSVSFPEGAEVTAERVRPFSIMLFGVFWPLHYPNLQMTNLNPVALNLYTRF